VGRELEFKYLCDGCTFNDVVDLLKHAFRSNTRRYEEGSYVNAYFKTSGEAKYMRFSINTHGDGELTVKVNDKGTTADRQEWNHSFSKDTVGDTLDMLQAALGEPTTVVWTFAEWHIDDVVVSVVLNQEKPQWVFLEIEAKELQTLNAWDQSIKGFKLLNLKQVKNSMYDIFVDKAGILL